MNRTCACQVLLVLGLLVPAVVFGQPYSSDFGVVWIVAPTGTMTPRSIVPAVRVGNFGTAADTGRAYYSITLNGRTVYSDSRGITTLAPGDEREIQFRAFVGGVGTYATRCSVALAGDENPANNRSDSAFAFAWTTPPVWTARRNVAPGSRAKPVKAGGALCWGRFSGGGQVFFALKGNGTDEFYRYHISGDSWHALAAVPPGERRRMVKKGGALAYSPADTLVYCFKGNNTAEFWCYNVITDNWLQRCDLPRGESGRLVKGGAALAFHQQGSNRYVYALKGNKTDEFWRYTVALDTWEQLKSVPPGPRERKVVEGSAMTIAGGSIYVVKATYGGFSRFSISGDSWVDLPPLPLAGAAGHKRKAKPGTGLAWGSNVVAALKGGCGEFWGYLPAGDTWYEMESLPRLPSGKPLKSGGALAYGNGYFWALKGNRTSEFYRYTQGTDTDDSGQRPDRQAGVSQASRFCERSFDIVPNPACSRAALVLGPSLAGHRFSVAVYDAAGRQAVVRQPSGNQEALGIDVGRLPAGVYIVRLTDEGLSLTRRLVVDH